MKLNTRQVADKLGCSPSAVGDMIKRGDLHDIAIRKEGAKRHLFMIDSKEVTEFAKTYKNYKRNGNLNPYPIVNSDSPQGLLSKLNARVEIINQKLDQLIQMWS